MRSRWLIFLILILVLAACGEDEPPAQSEVNNAPTTQNTNTPRLKVIVSEARVFTYPSRDSETVFRLIEGDEMPILARTEPDLIGVTWYQVGQGNQFGWIAGSQIEFKGDVTALRVVNFDLGTVTPLALSPTPIIEVSPTIAPLDDPIITINVPVAVVFEVPTRDSTEATRLLQGETADILGKTDVPPDVFYLIGREQRVLGWILETQVIVAGDLTRVPAVSLEEALAAVLPTESVVTEATLNRPTLIPTNSPARTDQPTQVAAVATTPPPITPSPSPDLAGTAQSAPTATDIVSNESATQEVNDAATEESGTPEPTAIPQIEPGVPPPFTMTLPEGWGEAHMLVPISSVYLQGTLPVSLYQGNFADGTFGFIWVVWGFPNVTSPGSTDLNLYADGLQLMRGVIFDSANCVISLGSERRQYQVGGLEAVGTIYSVTECPEVNDTAGFFAALEADGGNFAFFVGVEPVDTTDTGLPQIQAILDGVQFQGDSE